MGNLTIALGPGFTAGEDTHYVIETMRGHDLGRIISRGSAVPNTGIPGIIGGYGKERVIHAGGAGRLFPLAGIGEWVEKDRIIGKIQKKPEDSENWIPVRASISGIVRGMIREGFPVTEGFKIADIDPREDAVLYCDTISDKARCIAGSVLELVCAWEGGSRPGITGLAKEKKVNGWEELTSEKEIITVIGAGGKSTCIRYSSGEIRKYRKTCAGNYNNPHETASDRRLPQGTAEEILQTLEGTGYAVAGIPLKEGSVIK